MNTDIFILAGKIEWRNTFLCMQNHQSYTKPSKYGKFEMQKSKPTNRKKKLILFFLKTQNQTEIKIVTGRWMYGIAGGGCLP